MKHAELCLVCQGAGKVYPNNPAHPDYGETSGTTSASIAPVTCHGCGGKGWVKVEGEVVSIPSVWTEPNPLVDYTITTWPPATGDWLVCDEQAQP